MLDAARLMGAPSSAAVLAVNQLRGACLATPAIARGRLFIRTTEALYCIEGNAPSGGTPAARSLPTTLAELQRRYEQHQADWQNEPEAQIRLETLEAIAALDDPAVLPFLLRTVQQEAHWDICEEAAKSLGRKGAPAIAALILLVPDSRPFVRTIAIQELGRLRATAAIPALLKALDDPQPLVRCASLQALGDIGRDQPPQLPQLIAALLGKLGVLRGKKRSSGKRPWTASRPSATQPLSRGPNLFGPSPRFSPTAILGWRRKPRSCCSRCTMSHPPNSNRPAGLASRSGPAARDPASVY